MSDIAFPPDAELLVNGDIEPDCDNDGLGDETQDTEHFRLSSPPGRQEEEVQEEETQALRRVGQEEEVQEKEEAVARQAA